MLRSRIAASNADVSRSGQKTLKNGIPGSTCCSFHSRSWAMEAGTGILSGQRAQ